MSTPYDLAAVDMLNPFVHAFKIGSGDITWLEIVDHIAQRAKPVLLATGASTLAEVMAATRIIMEHGCDLVLMQCNTNYTAERTNLSHINLRVLTAYQELFPEAVLGLSDHTQGATTVLGAVALGARVIEKHFTDDPDREGSDHYFSMSPDTWREMVVRTRELEDALGDGGKRVQDNEVETRVVQRRCLRARRDLSRGMVIARDDLEALRPAPTGAVGPESIESVVGKMLSRDVVRGVALVTADLDG